MLVVFREGTVENEARRVARMMEAAGISCDVVVGLRKIVIHARTEDAELLAPFQNHPGIESMLPLSGSADSAEGYPFFPRQFFTNLMVMILVLGALVLLAGYLPAGLGARHDPLFAPAATNVEWYLLPVQKFLEMLTNRFASLGVLLTGLFSLVFFLWPWVDRSGRTMSRLLRLGATIFFLLLLALGVWGALA